MAGRGSRGLHSLAVALGQGLVAGRVHLHPALGGGARERALHLAGGAHGEHAVGDLGARRHQGAGGHHGAHADLDAVQQRGHSSTLLDGVKMASRQVAAGSLVTPGTAIPDGMLAMGAPCKVKGPLAGTAAERWCR